jgi:hypothetical protein
MIKWFKSIFNLQPSCDVDSKLIELSAEEVETLVKVIPKEEIQEWGSIGKWSSYIEYQEGEYQVIELINGNDIDGIYRIKIEHDAISYLGRDD